MKFSAKRVLVKVGRTKNNIKVKLSDTVFAFQSHYLSAKYVCNIIFID